MMATCNECRDFSGWWCKMAEKGLRAVAVHRFDFNSPPCLRCFQQHFLLLFVNILRLYNQLIDATIVPSEAIHTWAPIIGVLIRRLSLAP